MALHGGVPGRELWGEDADPTSRSRSRRSSRISSRHESTSERRDIMDAGARFAAAVAALPRCRATRTARCSASHGRRRPSRWRWRSTSAACSPGRNGRRRSARRSSGRRRPATPIPARPITITGSPRSNGSWPRRGLPTHRAGALPRRLAPRRRPHAARHADRAAAGRFRRIGFARRPRRFQAARDFRAAS